MREEIEKRLSVLIGLPLLDAGRAADLEWFHFGKPNPTIDYKGNPKVVGDWALHIQCAWRIVNEDRVFVAARDVYFPPDGSINSPDDFDWDVRNGNWRDVQMKLFLDEYNPQELIVTSVQAGKFGSVYINFTEGIALEIFPDDSIVDEYCEHWRFFRPATDEPHFVFSGNGIER